MKKLLYLFMILLFTACTPNYTKHEASLIVFKTPTMAFADAGFIHHNGEALKIVILVVGQPVFTLELGRKICLDGSCLSKEKFIHKRLSPYYPRDILQNIFLGKPIFASLNLVKSAGGFKQRLYKEDAYDIYYSVDDGQIRFKDKLAKVLIKSKKIIQ